MEEVRAAQKDKQKYLARDNLYARGMGPLDDGFQKIDLGAQP